MRATISTRLACTGVTLAARQFGVSREHLSRVLHGKRKANDELRRRLNRIGVFETVDGEEI